MTIFVHEYITISNGAKKKKKDLRLFTIILKGDDERGKRCLGTIGLLKFSPYLKDDRLLSLSLSLSIRV